MNNEEEYNELCGELEDTCEEYEGDLKDWEIEDALTSVKHKYQ